MKSIFFVILGVLLFQSGSCQEGASEFVSIFDGETLEGWKVSEENPGSFLVENGNLVARGGRAHIFYNGQIGGHDFQDFELVMKVMTNTKSNSGVYFHTKYQKKGWPEIGFEAQVNSKHSDPRKTGSLYGIVNMWAPELVVEPFLVKVGEKGEVLMLQEKAPSTDGEWFEYHIRVVGNRVVIIVDGEITVDWTQPIGWEMEGRKIGSGTVGFQAHDPSCEVYYKDIMLKILD